MTVERNVPTPEGRAAGQQLARLCDTSERAMLAEKGAAPYRCASCAFKPGTFPNGCLETVADALKCVVEGVPFYCHHSEKNGAGNHIGLCAGYLISRAALEARAFPEVKTPWPFSHEVPV